MDHPSTKISMSEMETEKEHFKKIIKDNGIQDEIEDVQIMPYPLSGEHMGSKCEKVIITFRNKKEKPQLELFVKKMATSPQMADMIIKFKLFDKESAFYGQLLPALKQYWIEKTG